MHALECTYFRCVHLSFVCFVIFAAFYCMNNRLRLGSLDMRQGSTKPCMASKNAFFLQMFELSKKKHSVYYFIDENKSTFGFSNFNGITSIEIISVFIFCKHQKIMVIFRPKIRKNECTIT